METDDMPQTSGAVTISLSQSERELLLLALGGLLNSVQREEHLTLELQALIARIRAFQPAA